MKTGKPVLIRIAQKDDAEALAKIIRSANAPVAQKFGLTPESAPKHPSNCTAQWIYSDLDRGVIYFLAAREAESVGCVGFERAPDGVCYMERLAVSPPVQGGGIGTALVNHFLDHARTEAMVAVSIGIIAEHCELRRWYENRGFALTEKRVYPHLPFTVAFMRRNVVFDFPECKDR